MTGHKDKQMENSDTQQDVLSLSEQLADVLDNAKFPDEQTVVCGALDEQKIAAIAAAGVQHVINFQPEDELSIDEKALVEAHGMTYSHLPIAGAEDLKQVNMLEFDKILKQHHVPPAVQILLFYNLFDYQ